MSTRAIRVRILAATVVLAAGTVTWAWLGWSASREHPGRALTGYLPLALLFALGTVSLIRGWWWGRMLATALALYSVLDAVDELAIAPSDWQSLGAALAGLGLAACLLGRSMFERFEGRAPPPLSWREHGMGVVRWAVVASACTLLAAVMNLQEAAEGLGLLGGEPVLRPVEMTSFVITAVFTITLSVGLGLLALQRTGGLLIVGGSVLVLSATMLRELVWGTMALRLAIVLAPGLLMAWTAIFVWGKPMSRFLRGQGA
jgi:hypothetical protein